MIRKRVLVTDDEEDIRQILRTFLEKSRYWVEEAADGRECIELLKKDEFDLLILDLMMPNLNGYEVLQLLPRNIRENMPIIILSARTEDADILKSYSLGISYYLTKPFDNLRLMNIVKYLLDDLDPEDRIEVEKSL